MYKYAQECVGATNFFIENMENNEQNPDGLHRRIRVYHAGCLERLE